MKKFLTGPILLTALPFLLSSANGALLWKDNFDAPDTNNFDGAVLTSRLSGTAAGDTTLRSFGFQQSISNNQLLLPLGGNGVRFGGQFTRYDWAAGSVASAIVAAGGFVVSFDWIPQDDSNNEWVSFQVGTINDDNGNLTNDDYGILFRNNGGTERFRNAPLPNGNQGAGDNFTTTPGGVARLVEITYAFTSFADGSPVSVISKVNGVVIANDTFNWDGNNGAMHMELGNGVANTRIDNFAVSTTAAYSSNLSALPLYTSIANNGTVGNLTSQSNGTPTAATYTLVAGAGDTDNAKFKITGNTLQSNGYNFIGIPDGTTLSVRIRSTASPSLTDTQAYLITVIADNDSDDLPDTWELATAFNLTDLKGRNPTAGPGSGTGNFDGDTLTDLQEFKLTRGLYPLLSPLLADTDGDGLQDGVELNPAAPRILTNPTIADTDGDGLNDMVENNSGTFVSASNPGTSPVDYDSDDDAFPDSYEIVRGSGPLNALQLPTLPAPLTTAVLTTDEASGIDPAKTYTHAVSGGYAATVNGVAFAPLRPVQPAPGFVWAATNNAGNAAAFNEINTSIFANWSPPAGDVTGPGLLELLGGFTYSGNGDQPGSFQTYTLTGLTPGQKYEVRLFVRVWSKVDSGRPHSVTFANGAQSVNAYILEDRPGIMLGNNNPDSAYTLVFPYTAAGTELTITAAVPFTTIPVSGSWHLYGLTNETTADRSFAITSLVFRKTPSPAATITFDSTPGAVYAVEYSTGLNTTGLPDGWKSLTTTLASGGTATTYTDTTIAGSAPRIFYRIRLIRL